MRAVSSATTTLAQILHAILVSTYHSSTSVCTNSMCPTAQSQNLLLLSCVCKPREDSPGYTGPLICSVLASFSQALARCAVGINPVVSCLEPDFLRASSPYSPLSVKQGCHILSSVKVIDCCGVSCSSTALNFQSVLSQGEGEAARMSGPCIQSLKESKPF